MTADPQLAGPLQRILVRESRSLLQYVSESFPWTTPQERKTLAHVQQLVKEELNGAVALSRYLARLRVPVPYFGAYPMSFTTINFVSLTHLLPLLAQHTRKMIADLESDLAAIHDPAARAVVETILANKRRHVEVLEELAAPAPAAAAA